MFQYTTVPASYVFLLGWKSSSVIQIPVDRLCFRSSIVGLSSDCRSYGPPLRRSHPGRSSKDHSRLNGVSTFVSQKGYVERDATRTILAFVVPAKGHLVAREVVSPV